MPNIVTTNLDNGSVVVEAGEFEDGLIEFAGADTYAAGTILARNTSNDKFQLFVIGGVSNGNGIPVAILTYEIEETGAGDAAGRVLISGIVNKNRLVVDADGDDSNITPTERDLLRNVGITPIDVDQLALVDNPQP